MDDDNKKTNFFSPDKLIAYSAVLIGLCALVVSIYEANIFRQQQKASVWPYLEFSFNNTDGFSYNIQNKGVGPAIVKWVIIKIDRKPITLWNEYANKIIDTDSLKFHYASSYIMSRVISANEEVKIISFNNPVAVRQAIMNLDRVSFKICYSSIFNDYWIMKSDSSGKETYQTTEYDVDSKNIFQN